MSRDHDRPHVIAALGKASFYGLTNYPQPHGQALALKNEEASIERPLLVEGERSAERGRRSLPAALGFVGPCRCRRVRWRPHLGGDSSGSANLVALENKPCKSIDG